MRTVGIVVALAIAGAVVYAISAEMPNTSKPEETPDVVAEKAVILSESELVQLVRRARDTYKNFKILKGQSKIAIGSE